MAAAWCERMWEFAAGVMLLSIGGGRSLQLPATLAFAMQLTQAALGAKVGGVVDRGGPLVTPLVALAAQSLAVALAAACAGLSLAPTPGPSPASAPFAAAGPALVIVLSCLARLATVASKLSVESHWAVVLAKAEGGSEALARLASNMRAVDLSCKIAAPTAVGFVISLWGVADAGMVLATLGLIAWPLEVTCLIRVYRDPWCKQLLCDPERGAGEGGGRTGAPPPSASTGSPAAAAARRSALRLYFSQRMWPSAVALSMLHLTVLSFGQLMTAYLLTLGVDVVVVSMYRSAGEVFGFLATRMKPWLVNQQQRAGAAGNASQETAAKYFIWFQVAMLVPAALGSTAWAQGELGPYAASLLLVVGVGLSRFGLWGFDLSVNGMLQSGIEPPGATGRVMGLQMSLEAAFGTLAGVAGIVLHDPGQFQCLALGSWISVCSAAVLHTVSTARGASRRDK